VELQCRRVGDAGSRDRVQKGNLEALSGIRVGVRNVKAQELRLPRE